jgi:hypothetical protein
MRGDNDKQRDESWLTKPSNALRGPETLTALPCGRQEWLRLPREIPVIGKPWQWLSKKVPVIMPFSLTANGYLAHRACGADCTLRNSFHY